MALLLLVEQQRMSGLANWQKLMSRLHIINTDALGYFATLAADAIDDTKEIDMKAVDVVYLDPMFPEDSYQDSKTGKGAKVGKHMQALHQLASPPTLEQEEQLLQSAQAVVRQKGQNTNTQGAWSLSVRNLRRYLRINNQVRAGITKRYALMVILFNSHFSS